MLKELPIATDRLIIRQFRREDAAAFHCWRNDPDVARYTLWDCPYPMEKAISFCSEQAAIRVLPLGEWYQLFVEEKASGIPVGDIGFGLEVDGNGILTVGYSIRKEQWGKGYATEAVAAAIAVFADAINASAVVAEIDVRNPASGRVLEKIGFAAGPVEPKRAFVKGEWCDEQDYILQLMPEERKGTKG